MEKQNPNKNFNMDDEIKKVQEELIKEGKQEKGIVDTDESIAEGVDPEELADMRNEKELERLKALKRIKSGDRVNYFMVDNDERVREVTFKFPTTKTIMNLSEYGVSGEGRMYVDFTKAIEVLEQNKLFISKFDIDDFCQQELEGFGGFLMNILRNPRKFIQNISK